eukprot:jgi/Mesvir1/11620/Mv00026-RA.1
MATAQKRHGNWSALRNHQAEAQYISIVTIAVILSAAALRWLQPVLVPLVLAVVVTFTMSPVVEFLHQRIKLPKQPAIFVTLSFGVLSIMALVILISMSIRDVAANMKTYEAMVIQMMRNVHHALSKGGHSGAAGIVEDSINQFPIGEAIAQATRHLLTNVVEGLSNTILVLIFSIYLMEGRNVGVLPPEGKPRSRRLQDDSPTMGSREGRGDAPRAVPGTPTSPYRTLFKKIESRIRHYITIKVGLSCMNATVTAATLLSLHVDMVPVFAVLAAVLNFIPHVGAIASVLLPLPVVLVTPGCTLTTVLLATGVPAGVHFMGAHFLEPRLLGQSLDLHPITVMLSLIFWGMIWGFSGMLLAAPLTASLKILCDATEPLALLLQGSFPGSNDTPGPDAEGDLFGDDSDNEDARLIACKDEGSVGQGGTYKIQVERGEVAMTEGPAVTKRPP